MDDDEILKLAEEIKAKRMFTKNRELNLSIKQN